MHRPGASCSGDIWMFQGILSDLPGLPTLRLQLSLHFARNIQVIAFRQKHPSGLRLLRLLRLLRPIGYLGLGYLGLGCLGCLGCLGLGCFLH